MNEAIMQLAIKLYGSDERIYAPASGMAEAIDLLESLINIHDNVNYEYER